jgi:hypothetical protein
MNDAREAWQTILVPPFCYLGTDTLGNFRAIPFHQAVSVFCNLPNATTLAAGKDENFVTIGTGTVVVARAAKGGINLKTQASSPANNDSAILTTVSPNASLVPLTVNSQPRMQTRVNLSQITLQLFSATLDQTITAVDPTASAGDGAGFVFDPTGALSTGLAVGTRPNWLAFQKINGVNTFIDTGIAVVAGLDYDLDVLYDNQMIPTLQINGAVVAGPQLGTLAAGTSGVTIGPLLGVQVKDGGTPAQHDVDVRFLSVERFIG